ncbi:hypothetical protein RhiirA5_427681 [Rhizophagus irregularis]|uniref:Uncharacterized protein n=1 Tax=Rhizophagus irregularis TaxID=588596 RepID=A0A2I1FAD6_9GLOM|nr:hypothetical protein RhiirA5_427681 [Rhizophagus irregularis]PKY31341.1 hypothetical protein RhiirB3_448899 [Rhizophagus irregularis]
MNQLFNILQQKECILNAQETPFCWKERVYKDSNMRLRRGSIRFEFNVDVRDFVEDN